MKKHISAGIGFIALLGLLIGGGVKAYFTDGASLLTSPKFEFGTVDIAVNKIKGGGMKIITPKEKSGQALWRVTNTGSKAVFIRAKIIEESSGSKGHDKDAGAEDKPDVDMTVKGWIKGVDGYYYLKRTLSRGDAADFDLTFEIDSPWSGEYKLYLESQAVQASNNAINVLWPENPR